MLISLNWLKQYVDIDDFTPNELAEKITKSGIEVESVEPIVESMNNVVVGYVKSCEQHPNADKLNLCLVDVGDEELQIICGAPNVATGQKVAVAKPGATLPGGMKIKKAKLRGVESNGMICSLQEIGIDPKFVQKEFESGIFVFPEDVEVGANAVELLNLDDVILEFELTPNRSDCLSMIGTAYEVAAILGRDIRLPEVVVEREDTQTKDYVDVKVEEPALSPYYGAFVIQDVNIGPSPQWMQNRLIAAGIRPINNVVDITNYVLLEYGQPLHAFDYDRFGTKEVVVRTASEKEQIVTLDDANRTLDANHLVITNGVEPVAIAGVMGGANSEVYEGTKNILLEAAYFDPKSVRKAAKDHNLRSEASVRFEKGIDPNRVKEAGLRACQLLQQYAGGKVLSGEVEHNSLAVEERVISFSADKMRDRIGADISTEQMEMILQNLRFPFERKDQQFVVTAPTRRGDISIVEDMVEEIARLYGYDEIPFTMPQGSSHAGGLTARQQLKRKVHQFMQGAGLAEAWTYSLTTEGRATTLVSPEVQQTSPNPIGLAMPMSEAHSHLRLSMLPELLTSLQYNLARKQQNVALYELGSIYITKEETLTSQPKEELRLSGVMTGLWQNHPWQKDIKQVDFYVVKGIIEQLFHYVRFDNVIFEAGEVDGVHPGRSALLKYNGETIGFLGQLHPALQKDYDLTETYVFDINFEKLAEGITQEDRYVRIPRFPSVSQDLAFVLEEHIPAHDVLQVIQEHGGTYLTEVDVFDVYQGEHMEKGKKSIAYRLLFQDPSATLKDEQVEKAREQIVKNVQEKFGAELRG
ncbi:phenylalanine--tRNA ligase subunit beta [Salirhabdus salicampi]|uniref:phenylalanine--tRNA ligase subunit beta n=1 Tax=Salirhabdus salicampi TaxID=476102 RepID=UPI0020C20A77|nr:phenylalanine--tRNA ligase subunit beta [Salirhabdus salicampi]MCP8617064.1 phenylalanine--tRNA ligase subunit beta [Salirhabdus salicampi]